MSKLFTGLFEESKVQRVDIYVVDSYDDAVPTKSIVAQHLEAEFLDAWNKRDRDFFFCLELRRFGAILGKGSE